MTVRLSDKQRMRLQLIKQVFDISMNGAINVAIRAAHSTGDLSLLGGPTRPSQQGTQGLDRGWQEGWAFGATTTTTIYPVGVRISQIDDGPQRSSYQLGVRVVCGVLR
jgi:hypothetical protein